MSQWLRVLATLVEDLDLVPRTFIRWRKSSVTPSLRWSDTFLDSVDTSTHDAPIHILRHTHIHTVISWGVWIEAKTLTSFRKVLSRKISIQHCFSLKCWTRAGTLEPLNSLQGKGTVTVTVELRGRGNIISASHYTLLLFFQLVECWLPYLLTDSPISSCSIVSPCVQCYRLSIVCTPEHPLSPQGCSCKQRQYREAPSCPSLKDVFKIDFPFCVNLS